MSRKKPARKPKRPDGPPLDARTEAQIKRIRQQLKEMKEYKALIAQDGLEPDEEDKRRESALIVKLLRLEKGKGPAKKKPAPKKKGKAASAGPKGRRARTRRKKPRSLSSAESPMVDADARGR